MLRGELQYITAKYPSISNKELECIQGSIGYSDTLSGESQSIWTMLSECSVKYPSISDKALEYIQGSIGYTDEQTQVCWVGRHNISPLNILASVIKDKNIFKEV